MFDMLPLRRFPSIKLGGTFASLTRLDPRLLTWLPLVPILLSSIIFRLGYLVSPHVTSDWPVFSKWGEGIAKAGLFQYWPGPVGVVYPLYMPFLGIYSYIQSWRGTSLLTATDQSNYFLARLLPFLFELLLISISYAWLRRERYLRWLIPLGISFAPIVILIGSRGGQLDACLIVFIALALVALNRDKPEIAWAFLALGVLVKLQAVIMFPLLVVLTFRRYGWRRLLIGLAFGGALGATYLLPFALGMGIQKALNPILGAAGTWPFTQFAGYSFWFIVTPQISGLPIPPLWLWIDDRTSLFGPLSYRAVGIFLFGIYTLLICIAAWKRATARREFVWATALYLGFFMLLTEMSAHYLIYAAVLAIISIAQDRRMWPLAIGLVYSASYQWIWVTFADLGSNWLGWIPWSRNVSTFVPWLNLGMLFCTTAIAIASTQEQRKSRLAKLANVSGQYFFLTTRIATVTFAVIICYFVAQDALIEYPTASWLTDNIAPKTKLLSENLEVTTFSRAQSDSAWTWIWSLTGLADPEHLSQYFRQGNYYLILDERASSRNFAARLADYTKRGATVLYQTNYPFGIVPRQAVLWTFRPKNPSNVIFDQAIRLVGYDLNGEAGNLSMILYWQALKRPDISYQVYLHLLDSQTGQLIGQADTQLGADSAPSNAWDSGQIVIQDISLPQNVFQNLHQPVHIDLGLYSLSTGNRAAAVSASGIQIGDHTELLITCAEMPTCGKLSIEF